MPINSSGPPALSAAQPIGGVRDRARGRDQVGQRNALVRRRPLLVDPDVSGAVLHGGDSSLIGAVAMAAVAEPTPATDHGLRSGGAALTLGERGHERMVTRDVHRVLAPALLGAGGGHGQLVVERRMVALDLVEEAGHVGPSA